MTDSKARGVIYRPDQAAQITSLAIDRAAEQTDLYGVELGIPGVDGYFEPLLPGELAIVVAQTHHGKSFLLEYVTQYNAARLLKKASNEVVVKISTEDTLETQVIYAVAAMAGESPQDLWHGRMKDPGKVKVALMTVSTVPIYRVCYSITSPETYTPLHLGTIQDAMRVMLNDMKKAPRLVVVDYLQALPLDPSTRRGDILSSRRLQVAQDTERLFQLGRQFKCPVIVAVQAKQLQYLRGRYGEIPLPIHDDAEEAHFISERADRALCLCMPKVIYEPGTVVKAGGSHSLSVTESQQLLRISKQRGLRPSGKVFLLDMDFQRMGYRLLDMKSLKLEN